MTLVTQGLKTGSKFTLFAFLGYLDHLQAFIAYPCRPPPPKKRNIVSEYMRRILARGLLHCDKSWWCYRSKQFLLGNTFSVARNIM